MIFQSGSLRRSRLRLLLPRRTAARRSSSTPAGTSTCTSSSPRRSACGSRMCWTPTSTPTTSPAASAWRRLTGAGAPRSRRAMRSRSGALRLRALATPGHRPEHLSIVVADLSRGEDPWLVLTGDSLLVGDLARPDLAVELAHGRARFAPEPGRAAAVCGDRVELWPAHVGGSLAVALA